MDVNKKIDVAVMSVTDTEYNAVKLFLDLDEKQMAGDSQIYGFAEFTRDGRSYSIVHAKSKEMGMTSAAVTSMKLINRFRPKYLIMVGIAAGVALTDVADQIYGDVIVPDIVWNYSSGKFVSPEKADITFGDLGFLPRSTSEAIPEEILPYIRSAVESPENECHVHIGPMACGTTVVANRIVLEKQIHSQFKDTVGLDMESYAVVYTANHATEPRPVPIIIKSVCDFANSEKSDDYQKFAAYTSCEFAKLLYEKYLPLDD